MEITPNVDRSVHLRIIFNDEDVNNSRFVLTSLAVEMERTLPKDDDKDKSQPDPIIQGWYVDDAVRKDINHLLMGVEIPKGKKEGIIECTFPEMIQKKDNEKHKILFALKKSSISAYMPRKESHMVYADIQKISLQLPPENKKKQKGYLEKLDNGKWHGWQEISSTSWEWERNPNTTSRILEAWFEKHCAGNKTMEFLLSIITSFIFSVFAGFFLAHCFLLISPLKFQRLILLLLCLIGAIVILLCVHWITMDWIDFVSWPFSVG
ncbi:MAG: hypothetical protein LN364_02465, partial [Candidatus Thermoplasmatota archaeon]|nr:hypothetical protein [Candidatus Thermoplasmatota archaeon]